MTLLPSYRAYWADPLGQTAFIRQWVTRLPLFHSLCETFFNSAYFHLTLSEARIFIPTVQCTHPM